MNPVQIFKKVLSFLFRAFLVALFVIAIILGIENQWVYSKGDVTINACIVELDQEIRACHAKYIYEYLGTYYQGRGSMFGKCEGKFSVGDIIYVNIAMKDPKRSQWKIPDVKEFLP
jgi:hypothetical protein